MDYPTETWPAGRLVRARKDHRCDYWRGQSGPCPLWILKGTLYFDPGESNPTYAGGFGGYRFCLSGDHAGVPDGRTIPC